MTRGQGTRSEVSREVKGRDNRVSLREARLSLCEFMISVG